MGKRIIFIIALCVTASIMPIYAQELPSDLIADGFLTKAVEAIERQSYNEASSYLQRIKELHVEVPVFLKKVIKEIEGTLRIKDVLVKNQLTLNPGYAWVNIENEPESSKARSILISHGSIEANTPTGWIRLPSGNTLLKVGSNEFSYAFREKNLYRITVYPTFSLYKSASSLPGYRPLPPEPEMLPDTGTVKVWKLHEDTFKNIGESMITSGAGVGLLYTILSLIDAIEGDEYFLSLSPLGIISWGVGSALGGFIGLATRGDYDYTLGCGLGGGVGGMAGMFVGFLYPLFTDDTSDWIPYGGFLGILAGSVGSAIPGLVWGISNREEKYVRENINRNKKINRSRREAWERNKQEVISHNRRILDEANREIEKKNRERNKVEIEEIISGKVEVIRL